MTQFQQLLQRAWRVQPPQRVRTTKRVEYWIHIGQDADDTANNSLDILPGDEWRKARKIAANPPDNVFLVERVLIWCDNRDEQTRVEYEVLFER